MNRRYAHKVVRANCTVTQANDYIREAEHMEGNGYWRQYFSTDQEIIDDLMLYFVGREQETKESIS